jgi:hypothetical protein
VAGLARRLGPVHRDVGVAQHVAGLVVAPGADGDADARAARDLGAGHPVGLAHRLLDARGQLDHALVGLGAAQQQRELVSPQARHQVIGAHPAGNALGHERQELVAGGMAQAVVDELEAVEVQEHHGVALGGVPYRLLHHLVELLHEAAPVGQAGEGVVEGDVVHLLQVLHRDLGLAPRRLGGGFGDGAVGLLLLEEGVQDGQQQGQRRADDEDRRQPRGLEGEGHHRRGAGAGRIDRNRHAEVAGHVRPGGALAALEAQLAGHQHRVDQELHDRCPQRGDHHHPRGAHAQRLEVGQHQRQQGAGRADRQPAHGGAGDARGPAPRHP